MRIRRWSSFSRWTPIPLGGDSGADFFLVENGVRSCEVNRQNQDGHVMDMRNHSFNLFANGSLVFDGDPGLSLFRRDEYCVAFDGVSADGKVFEDPYIRDERPREEFEWLSFLTLKV